MENKITLYIAEHNITGLKYFGKTTKYFTEEELQLSYHGSGTYWLRHLVKHGDDVTMKILGIYTSSEVKHTALTFSKENDIIYKVDEYGKKVWANLKFEDGFNGGCWFVSKQTREKISESLLEYYKNNISACLNIPKSESTKKKISESKKGTDVSIKTRKKLSVVGRGKVVSEKTREKISKIHKGKIVSDKTKKKISESKKGIPLSTEHKAALAANKKGMLGLTHTSETKQKISEKKLGKSNGPHTPEAIEKMKKVKGPQEQLICPHCNKSGGISNMKRWHMDNCKLNMA